MGVHRRNGYDLADEIASLYWEVGDFRKVRFNYGRPLHDLWKENCMRPMFEWCDRNNLRFTGHRLETRTCGVGSWAKQGDPFYGGSVMYETEPRMRDWPAAWADFPDHQPPGASYDLLDYGLASPPSISVGRPSGRGRASARPKGLIE